MEKLIEPVEKTVVLIVRKQDVNGKDAYVFEGDLEPLEMAYVASNMVTSISAITGVTKDTVFTMLRDLLDDLEITQIEEVLNFG